MKNPISSFYQNLILLFLITLPTSLHCQTFNDIGGSHHWEQVKIGAGGWLVGMDMQKEGNVIYCRADVGGAYRLDVGSDTWIQLVDTTSVPDLADWDSHEYGVASIASAQSDENVVYMLFANGNFYRSENKGDLWEKKNLNIYVEANGEGRQQGERIAVDPINSDIVYIGSNRDGLLRTTDGGDSWETLSQVPAGNNKQFGIGTVVFDYFGDTLDSKTQLIYASVHETGIYKSTDAGENWNHISEGFVGNGRFEDAEVGPDGTYYVVLADAREVWKYQEDQWTLIFSDSYDPLRDVCIDPHHGDTIFVSDYAGRSFRTQDGGENWTKVDRNRESETDIPWLSATEVGWFSHGEIIFDTKVPGKLWICQGIGMWNSTDIYDNKTTWHSLSKGIEELVSTDIVSPPNGRPLAAFWDRAIFRIENPNTYPSVHYPVLDFESGWDLDYCPTHSSFLVATVADHRSCCKDNKTCYSADRGKTWTMFQLPEDAVHGNLAVSAHKVNNMVLLPGDGVMPYYTFDRGQTWFSSELPETTSGGFEWYSSGQDILTSDAVDSLTFYIYHSHKGIYKTVNGGIDWELVNHTVPKGAVKKVKLISVQDHAQHLFLSLGLDKDEALLRSVDGGVSWEEFPGTHAVMVSIGKAASGADYPSIYFYGRAEGQKGIWRSTDEGTSWDMIGNYPLGITANLNAFEADKNHFGLVYVGFPGNGVAMAYDTAFVPNFDIPESEPDHIGPLPGKTTAVDNHSSSNFSLSQNFANPFNHFTNIEYVIPTREYVTLKVFDVSGKEVMVLADGFQNEGKHIVELNMNGMHKGIYLYKLMAGSFSSIKKMVLQ